MEPAAIFEALGATQGIPADAIRAARACGGGKKFKKCCLNAARDAA